VAALRRPTGPCDRLQVQDRHHHGQPDPRPDLPRPTTHWRHRRSPAAGAPRPRRHGAAAGHTGGPRPAHHSRRAVSVRGRTPDPCPGGDRRCRRRHTLRNEILDATTRYRHRHRHDAAQAAGDAARRAAEQAGHDPDAAYAAAYRTALGTPTRGGAHIPHFAHHVLPAPSIGSDTHSILARNGIRAYGPETADDYTVIRRRGKDLTAWGLRDVYGTLRPTSIGDLAKAHSRFVDTVLTADERDALRTYTSGRHIGSGAYIQINDVFTGRTTTPSPAVANGLSVLKHNVVVSFEMSSRCHI
jgi:hypothetical protein